MFKTPQENQDGNIRHFKKTNRQRRQIYEKINGGLKVATKLAEAHLLIAQRFFRYQAGRGVEETKANERFRIITVLVK